MSSIGNRTHPSDDTPVLGVVNHATHILFKVAVIAVFIFLLFYGVRTAYDFGHSVFTTTPVDEPPGKETEVTILPGMSTRSIGNLLVRANLVRNATVFYVQAKIYGYDLLPGTYRINSSQSIESILLQLSKGPDS